MIHPSAEISDNANIAKSVKIGAYCKIAANVTLESGVILEPHVTLESGVHLSRDTHVHAFAHLGNGRNSVMVHKECTIREFSEIGRCTEDHATITIHPYCYIMAYVTIRSGVQIHEHCIITNNVYLGENCTCQPKVIVAAKAKISKNCTLGTGCMIGGVSTVVHDIPPYCLVEGSPRASIRGLNLIGMRRSFGDRKSINKVKQVFMHLKKSDFPSLEAEKMLSTAEDTYAKQFLAFVSMHKIYF